MGGCAHIQAMELDFASLKEEVVRAFNGDRTVVDRPGLIRSAVLLCIVDRDPVPSLVFTRRAMTVARHRGQISLPGGVVEPADEGPVDTALREAAEEISLDRNLVDVVTVLDDQITTTGFVITPVVGFATGQVSFEVDPAEVDEVFEVPLSTLTNPANHMMQILEHRGVRFRDHRYFAGSKVIWGATGRILRTFLSGLGLG